MGKKKEYYRVIYWEENLIGGPGWVRVKELEEL